MKVINDTVVLGIHAATLHASLIYEAGNEFPILRFTEIDPPAAPSVDRQNRGPKAPKTADAS